MTATAQNVVIYKGDTKIIHCTVTDDAGDAKSLSGATIKWGLYVAADTGTVLTKDTDAGVVIVSPALGIFEVTLLSADTADLSAGWYAHEAEVTDSDGNVSTVFTGIVEVKASRVGAGA